MEVIVKEAKVPKIAGNTSGLPTPATSNTARNNSFPQLCGPNSGDSTATGRLEGLRQRFRAEDFRAIDLIFRSWREKTNTNYKSAWKSWEGWCATRCICPFSANVLEFLSRTALLFHVTNNKPGKCCMQVGNQIDPHHTAAPVYTSCVGSRTDLGENPRLRVAIISSLCVPSASTCLDPEGECRPCR